MPEGPTIYMLRERTADFKGRKITEAYGLAKTLDPETLVGHTIKSVESCGKYYYLILNGKEALRFHFGMFGSYRINEQKETNARLHLGFKDGTELNFYTTSVHLLQSEDDQYFDATTDVMSPDWDEAAALKKLKALPKDTLICDALLNQEIFAGVGNIIKNEVLWRMKIHPESKVANIPARLRRAMVGEAVSYSFQFLEWKKENTLKRHWDAYAKKVCPRDGHTLTKAYTGTGERRSFFCGECQQQY